MYTYLSHLLGNTQMESPSCVAHCIYILKSGCVKGGESIEQLVTFANTVQFSRSYLQEMQTLFCTSIFKVFKICALQVLVVDTLHLSLMQCQSLRFCILLTKNHNLDLVFRPLCLSLLLSYDLISCCVYHSVA